MNLVHWGSQRVGKVPSCVPGLILVQDSQAGSNPLMAVVRAHHYACRCLGPLTAEFFVNNSLAC
jgi:hypothetical protein